MSDPLHHAPTHDRREKAGVKVPHLVFGLLFLGVAAIWALGASGVLGGEALTVLGPAVLVAAGVIGLGASLASARNRSSARSLDSTEREETRQSGYTEDTENHDDTEEIR